MKNRTVKWGAALLALLLLAGILAAPALADAPATQAKELTVLFTHDTHDHFYPDAADRGGYARLATLLKEERARAGDAVVTLDAGDFSMGSLFQTIYTTDAPELIALGAMGYDVTTFGNHEYDYRPQGLADMLNAAKGSGEELPAIVQANYVTPKDPADAASQAAVAAMKNYPVTDYTVLEKGGLRVAVFGVMGVDSDECAPMSGMTLEPLIDAAKRVVADIQAKEGADYIICLSHSGTVNGKGEDYELAKAVDGIDLIISGHTHSTLETPIEVNGTYIVSCGEYTKNLGKIVLGKSGGAVSAKEYRLIPVDGSVAEDGALVSLTNHFKSKVEENYLDGYGLEFDQALATAGETFTIPQTGDLIGAAYISTVREVEGADHAPIAFAVAPEGVIRDVIRAGETTTSKAFDILSLGVGADGTPGYPLVSVYLTGKDLKNAFEVDASVSALMPAARLYGAGSHWSYNPNRMFLDRLTSCEVTTPGIAGEVRDDQLYRVVADLYSGQMLATVKEKSFGLLSITPRNADGSEVTDFEDCIIHDAEGREVKAWYALARYLQTAGQDLAPAPAGKSVEPSWNPIGLIIPLGLPTLIVMVVGLLVIALVVFLVTRIVRRRGRRGGRNSGYRPYRGK